MGNNIEQEVKEEINYLILEELTVSQEVLDASDKVVSYILSNIKKQNEVIFTNGGGRRELIFQIDLFDSNISINFCVTNYNFLNQTYYSQYTKKYYVNTECGSTYKRVGEHVFAICWINYLSFDFKPIAKFYEDLHHELNHILQQEKGGKTYPDALKYSNISTDIYSQDEVKKDVANLLYLCNPQEQDSFVSSVYNYVRYNYLIKMNGKDIDYYIKETDAFENICKLKELYKKIKDNKEKYRNIILDYHNFERWDRFDKRVKNALHRFEEKFAMCVKKCKKDFLLYEGNTWCDAKLYKNGYLLK